MQSAGVCALIRTRGEMFPSVLCFLCRAAVKCRKVQPVDRHSPCFFFFLLFFSFFHSPLPHQGGGDVCFTRLSAKAIVAISGRPRGRKAAAAASRPSAYNFTAHSDKVVILFLSFFLFFICPQTAEEAVRDDAASLTVSHSWKNKTENQTFL